MSIKLNVETNQEAFDAVVRHLRKQNRQASWDGACAYRTPPGGRCAIGALIDDDQYNKTIEGQSIRELIADRVVDTDISDGLLVELQVLHDRTDSWNDTEKMQWVSENAIAELRVIAYKFGLDDKIIDEQFVWKTGNEIAGLRA